MNDYHLRLFNLELSFKAKAEQEIVEEACALLEERYNSLAQASGHLSKEKLLAYVSLDLAAEYIQLLEEKELNKDRAEKLLYKIKETSKNVL